MSSPVRKAWMKISMEDELFPKQQIPLSTPLKWTNEKAEANTYGYNAPQELPERCLVHQRTILGILKSRYILEVYFRSLAYELV